MPHVSRFSRHGPFRSSPETPATPPATRAKTTSSPHFEDGQKKFSLHAENSAPAQSSRFVTESRPALHTACLLLPDAPAKKDARESDECAPYRSALQAN